MSHFNSVELLPEDPIFHLPVLFNADQHAKKVNLSVGSYKNAQGKSYVLECVRHAEKIIYERKLDKDYLPIAGKADFINATLKLLFGHALSEISDRTFGMQTIGGTGALRVASEFFARIGFREICLPDPTWANHGPIFKYSGLKVGWYPYYDAKRHVLNFSGICDALKKSSEHTVFLFHVCCHNPSGMDLSQEQWKELSSLVKKLKLIPFFDVAYQGFGVGIEEDAYPMRLFVEHGHEMFVANSFSKNMGLYGERAGSLAVVTSDQDTIRRTSSQLKQIARSSYSNPPLSPERIVTLILQTESLAKLWSQELAGMRERIQEMRVDLVSSLKSVGIDCGFLEKQKGIFAYLGLTVDQVLQLRSDYGIYVAENGRANLASLNSDNFETVAAALAKVMKK